MQGKFRLTFGYDELRRNRSDSYQTPYNGAGHERPHAAGRRGWCRPSRAARATNSVVNVAERARPGPGDRRRARTSTRARRRRRSARCCTPTAAQIGARQRRGRAPTCRSFHNVDLSTKRTRYDAGRRLQLQPEVGRRRRLPARAQGRHEADGDGVAKHRRRHLDDHSGSDRHRTTTRSICEPELQGREELRAGRRTTARSSRTTCRSCRGRTGRPARPAPARSTR